MKKKRVPKLRFPEFSNSNENNHFTTHRFEDIFQFSTGKNIKQSEASTEFEIPCVRYGELYHLYDEVIREIINKTNLDKDKLKFSHGDEILIPSAGEDPLDIGSASALTIKNIAIGRTINILRPKQESLYSQIFVSYYINQRLRRIIATLAKGVSISNVYNSDLRKLKITLPSYDEQLKIANFLSSVDQKVQQLRRKKELLEEYKNGVMQKLFPLADGQAPEIRFKDENGEDFPDWEYKELGDISDRITDKNEDQEYDFVLTNSAVQGVVSQTEYFDKSIANKDNLGGYYIVHKDDFVYNPRISSEAPVGPIKRNKLKTGVMSPLYSIFRINEKHLDFFEYFFETTIWHRYMHSVANFGARHDRMNITVNDFQKLPIPVPSESEREKITNFINSVSEKLQTVNRKLELAEKFKQGLLQQMFV